MLLKKMSGAISATWLSLLSLELKCRLGGHGQWNPGDCLRAGALPHAGFSLRGSLGFWRLLRGSSGR